MIIISINLETLILNILVI